MSGSPTSRTPGRTGAGAGVRQRSNHNHNNNNNGNSQPGRSSRNHNDTRRNASRSNNNNNNSSRHRHKGSSNPSSDGTQLLRDEVRRVDQPRVSKDTVGTHIYTHTHTHPTTTTTIIHCRMFSLPLCRTSKTVIRKRHEYTKRTSRAVISGPFCKRHGPFWNDNVALLRP